VDKRNSIKQLFQKFLHEQCNEEEINLILHYLQHDPDSNDLPEFEEVNDKMQELQSMDDDRANAVFLKIIDSHAVPAERPAQQFIPIWMKVAASLTVFFLLSMLTYQYFSENQLVTYTTAFGETQKFILQDGSEVTLNSNSSLMVSRDWDEDQDRLVSLRGEAFFKVSHTEHDQKFIVETEDQMQVVVLGTEFNVNSRKDISQVVLRSGKVQVLTPSKKDIIIEPGEMVAYEKDSEEWVKKSVETELYTSWTQNLLLFRESTLKDVAQVLQANFGYEVAFEDDSLELLRFTGSNPANAPELLLKTLELSFELRVKKDGKKILFQKPE
jgi:ferric-dicitrate binding protein FerR (iron transport regulator)